MSKLLKNNQKFYIVPPPATKEYKELIPKSDELFKHLYNTAGRLDNVKNYKLL